MSRRKSPSGFTLLEVLLALAIFTIIGIATARYLQQVRDTKEAAFQDMDLYNAVRSAISMLRYDLSQAFHISYEDLGDETKQMLLQNQAVAHTLFDGRKNQMIFTSLSHRVYYQGRRESEQTEISYFLQEKRGNEFPSLMKRESFFIDSDLYSGGSIYTILDNVRELQFAYWDEKTSRWVDDWSSDDGQYRDRFPLSVRMRLAVQDPKGKSLDITTQFKVAFPNNQAFLVQF